MVNHEWRVITPVNEDDKLLYDNFMPIFRNGYIEIDDNKYCLPVDYVRIMDSIENFEIRENDVFVTSMPKTGMTKSGLFIIQYGTSFFTISLL